MVLYQFLGLLNLEWRTYFLTLQLLALEDINMHTDNFMPVTDYRNFLRAICVSTRQHVYQICDIGKKFSPLTVFYKERYPYDFTTSVFMSTQWIFVLLQNGAAGRILRDSEFEFRSGQALLIRRCRATWSLRRSVILSAGIFDKRKCFLNLSLAKPR